LVSLCAGIAIGIIGGEVFHIIVEIETFHISFEDCCSAEPPNFKGLWLSEAMGWALAIMGWVVTSQIVKGYKTTMAEKGTSC
jgi:hypothetical protein